MNELKEVEYLFNYNQLTNLIKSTIDIQNFVLEQKNHLNYSGTKKNYNLSNYSSSKVIFRDIYKGR